MAHRMRLVSSTILAVIAVVVALLPAPPAATPRARAAEPTAVETENVEFLGTYGRSSLGARDRAGRMFVERDRSYLVSNHYDSADPVASRNVVDEYNISDPRNPRRTRAWGVSLDGNGNNIVVSGPGTSKNISDIFVEGSTAYVAAVGRSLYSSGGQFSALNLGASPPSVICQFFFAPLARVVEGNFEYAYVGTDKGVTVLDISNPTPDKQCRQVGHYDTESYVRDLEMDGGRLYVATGSNLLVLSLESPTSPAHVTSYRPSVPYDRIAVQRTIVYGTSNRDVSIVVTHDPANVRLIGTYPHGAYDVAVAGLTLYVGTQSNGLHVVDMVEATAPEQVGHYLDRAIGGAVYEVFAKDGLVHTPDGIYRYLPSTFHFTATAPTVLVNGKAVPVGSSVPLGPPDKVTFAAPGGKGEIAMTCKEALLRFAHLYGYLSEAGISNVLLSILLDYDALVGKYCNKTPTSIAAPAQATWPDLVFRLESGGVMAGGAVPGLLMDIETTAATVHSTGLNRFAVTRNARTGATTVGCLSGTVRVKPANGALPTITLTRNQQVTVTSGAVSPVTSFGSTVFVPIALR